MKPGFTIHEVQIGSKVIAPGVVAEFEDDVYADMIALGAVKEPTEDQLALHEALKPEAKDEEKSPEREALEVRAKEVGAKFQANTSDDVLKERIAKAEAKAKAQQETTL